MIFKKLMGLTIPVFVNISSQYGVRLGQAQVNLDLHSVLVKL